MFFADRLTLDKPRRNADGYMGVHARAARTGIYQYLGREIDPEGKHFTADQVVNVYRPASEVFDKASLGSFVGKPITDDHPSQGVNAANWRDLARGTIMGAARDGEFVGFDLAFMDAALITAIDDGKRELSNGYAAEITVEDGEYEGTAYQAVQRNIRGNHVAVVDAGRAGDSCRIGDAAPCEPIASDDVKKLLVDQRTYDANRDGGNNRHNDAPSGDRKVPKLILVDGLQVDVSNPDIAEATINTLLGRIKTADEAKAKAEGEVVSLTATNVALTADKTALETKLADAKITPQMLRDEAKRYADVVGKAKALGVTHAEDADAAAIMRAVVDAKLGALAKDYTEDHVGIAFAALTKDVKPEADKSGDKIIDAIGGGIRPVGDAKAGLADARNARLARLENAHLPTTGQAAN